MSLFSAYAALFVLESASNVLRKYAGSVRSLRRKVKGCKELRHNCRQSGKVVMVEAAGVEPATPGYTYRTVRAELRTERSTNRSTQWS